MYVERLVAEVFGGCNYKCTMCPQTFPGRDKEFLNILPFELYKDILDQIDNKPTVLLSGSGEPTLNKKLPIYIEEAKRRGMKPIIYTNGLKVQGSLMQDIFDAGLHLCRFSVIGYNRETYKKSMAIDAWDIIIDNIQQAIEYAGRNKLSSYHLILDNDNIDYELEQYINNFVKPLGIGCEIWKMHNWSGNYKHTRSGSVTKCNRPFAPEITIRAGGIGKHRGAVMSCCQTLGPPNEKQSVLGHSDSDTLENIYNGTAANNLREAHRTSDWSLAPYCKDCDFRLHDPEVLVYTNRNTKLYQYDETALDLTKVLDNAS